MAEATPQTVHVIVTMYPTGIGVRSPQMPELFAGYPSQAEALAAIPQLLQFGGAADGARVVRHYEYILETAEDHVMLVRAADDEHLSQRATAFQALRSALVEHQGAFVRELTPTSLGEYVIIAAVPGDELEWMTDQADKPGEPVNVVWPNHSEQVINFTTVARAVDAPGPEWERVDSGKSTMSELISDGVARADQTSHLLLVSA